VRVHTGGEASRATRTVDALAYTKGHDIVFGAGQYAPGTMHGDRLLAHELTHVMQQRGKVMRVQRQRVHMASGRYVGQITAAGNNVREEVIDVMDRLAYMNAYASSTDYNNEMMAVSALSAGATVSPSLIPQTIVAINANDIPTLEPTDARYLGLSITGTVGQGMDNPADDIRQLQTMLLQNWHITSADYATENAALPVMNVNVPDSSIPKTIEGITKLKRSYVAGTHTAQFRRQLSLSLEANQRLGSTMEWVPSGPTSGNTFQTWASAPTQPATSPPWTAATTINCWEMVLLAAFERGLTTWQWIHNLYTTGGTGAGWFAALPGRMSSGPRVTYRVNDPDSPSPHRGQIVFFNGADHVALAEGYRDGTGRSVIISFWPPPGQPSIPNTADKVKRTTIEELVNYMVGAFGPTTVDFASSPW